MRLDKPVGEALDAFTLRKWRELVPSLSDSDLSQLRQCLLDRLTRYGINARFERMSYEEILDLDDTDDWRRVAIAALYLLGMATLMYLSVRGGVTGDLG